MPGLVRAGVDIDLDKSDLGVVEVVAGEFDVDERGLGGVRGGSRIHNGHGRGRESFDS